MATSGIDFLTWVPPKYPKSLDMSPSEANLILHKLPNEIWIKIIGYVDSPPCKELYEFDDWTRNNALYGLLLTSKRTFDLVKSYTEKFFNDGLMLVKIKDFVEKETPCRLMEESRKSAIKTLLLKDPNLAHKTVINFLMAEHGDESCDCTSQESHSDDYDGYDGYVGYDCWASRYGYNRY